MKRNIQRTSLMFISLLALLASLVPAAQQPIAQPQRWLEAGDSLSPAQYFCQRAQFRRLLWADSLRTFTGT